MYDLIKLLLKIGLAEKEAKVYLISLKIGTNPASVIAKNAELNRCTTYSILEGLTKKGLMYQIEKDTIKYFTAVGPRQLIMCIEEQQRDLSYHKNEIMSKIKDFDKLRHPNQILPPIKSYSGKAGINKLYNEVINEPFLFINAHGERKKHQFFGQYAQTFLTGKKTIHLTIREEEKVSNIKLVNPGDLLNIPICAPIELIGKYKLFIIDPEEDYGIEIRQPRIIDEHQRQFNYLWSIKKDPSY